MTEDNVPAGTRGGGVKEFPEEGKQRAVGSSHAHLGGVGATWAGLLQT